MKRLLIGIIAFVALTAAAFANFGNTGGHLTGFWQAPTGDVAASITFLQCAQNTTDGSSFTFSAQNTGTASSDRHTIVTIAGEDSASDFTVSTVTVGGDSATELYSTLAAASVESAIFGLANTAGTSEDVVVTFSEAVTSANICLYQVNNLNSLTPVDTSNDAAEEACASGGLNSVCDLVIDAQNGGILVGVLAKSVAGSSAVTWSGLTEDQEVGASESSISTASHVVTADETNRTVTITPGGGGNVAAVVSLK